MPTLKYLKNKRTNQKNSKLIGAYLQKLGYIGVLGIDYLITSKEVLFVEINARYQASTPILNKALKQAGLNSIQYMNTLAFAGQNLPEQKIIDNIQVPYSFISYIEGTWKNRSVCLIILYQVVVKSKSLL